MNAIQTHDQIGNRARGDRLLTLAEPKSVSVAYALLLILPFVPMIFMGEEFGATSPFLFFADFDGDLAEAVRKGRRAEFAAFAAHGGDVPDPLSPATFQASVLDREGGRQGQDWRDLTARALAFRHNHVVPLLGSEFRNAQVERTGPAGLLAEWSFDAGTLQVALSFGSTMEAPPPVIDPKFSAGRLGVDPFAISATTLTR